MSEDPPSRRFAADPFAETFFTLAAMTLLAIALGAQATPPPAEQAQLVFSASARGVAIGAGEPTPPGRLLDDAALRERIAQARARNDSILVVIAADGLESAFALEALLGGASIRQIRLERGAAPPIVEAPPP
jgi:hypothetical protein